MLIYSTPVLNIPKDEELPANEATEGKNKDIHVHLFTFFLLKLSMVFKAFGVVPLSPPHKPAPFPS